MSKLTAWYESRTRARNWPGDNRKLEKEEKLIRARKRSQPNVLLQRFARSPEHFAAHAVHKLGRNSEFCFHENGAMWGERSRSGWRDSTGCQQRLKWYWLLTSQFLVFWNLRV